MRMNIHAHITYIQITKIKFTKATPPNDAQSMILGYFRLMIGFL